MPKDKPMKLVQINFPLKMIEKIDKLVEQGYAGTRSDFIRAAVGEKLHEFNGMKERKPKH